MKIDVSIGEVIDKITILEIKMEKFKNEDKLNFVRKEYELLKAALKKNDIRSDFNEFKKLKKVNMKLWEIEDKIRVKELNNEFDDEFIELARSVYFENDKRAALKKSINIEFKSDLIEEVRSIILTNEYLRCNTIDTIVASMKRDGGTIHPHAMAQLVVSVKFRSRA